VATRVVAVKPSSREYKNPDRKTNYKKVPTINPISKRWDFLFCGIAR